MKGNSRALMLMQMYLVAGEAMEVCSQEGPATTSASQLLSNLLQVHRKRRQHDVITVSETTSEFSLSNTSEMFPTNVSLEDPFNTTWNVSWGIGDSMIPNRVATQPEENNSHTSAEDPFETSRDVSWGVGDSFKTRAILTQPGKKEVSPRITKNHQEIQVSHARSRTNDDAVKNLKENAHLAMAFIFLSLWLSIMICCFMIVSRYGMSGYENEETESSFTGTRQTPAPEHKKEQKPAITIPPADSVKEQPAAGQPQAST